LFIFATYERFIKERIDALKQFNNNPDAIVVCPDCKTRYLKSKDEVWPDSIKKDRYLYCGICKGSNVATMNIE